MDFVRLNELHGNAWCSGQSCTACLLLGTPKTKRAKIRAFYTTIHGFMLSKFRNKTVSK